MNKLKISQVQFQASHVPALNAKIIEKSFNNTLKFKPHLICTPECSNIITNDKLIPNSTDIHVSFHRPLIIGKCFSKTEILKLGKNVVSIKGQVFTTDDKLIATALHTGFLLSTEKLKWSLIRINLEVKNGSYIEIQMTEDSSLKE